MKKLTINDLHLELDDLTSQELNEISGGSSAAAGAVAFEGPGLPDQAFAGAISATTIDAFAFLNTNSFFLDT